MEYISPNFTFNKLENHSFNDLIDVFEDRITNWSIRPSKTLLETQHGYFASTGILLAYFEAIQSYIKGQVSSGNSRAFFVGGFEAVFASKNGGHVKQLASTIYTQARCGFFHEGLMREKIFFSTAKKDAILVTLPRKNGNLDLNAKIESAIINPIRFQWCVERHFNDYINKLRDSNNQTIRDNFKKIVELNWKIDNEGPFVGMTRKDFFEK